MPFKDKEQKRVYQRIWIAENRRKWFEANGPCVDCGSWISLELDHVDPKEKVSHRLWSWSKSRREVELAKCVARCHDCHKSKIRRNLEHSRGEANPITTLRTDQVLDIRARYERGERRVDLAREFNTSEGTISNIVNRRTWKHI